MSPRILTASLISPIASLLPLAVLAIATLVNPETVGVKAGDDAPIRASGVISFVLLPVAYPVLVFASSVIGFILKATHKLSIKNLITISVLVSVILGILLGMQSPFGIKDQLIGIAVFSAFAMFSLILGAHVWWFVAVKWHNNPLKRDLGDASRPKAP